MIRAPIGGRLAVLIATSCFAAFAGATAQRTFVASYGVDNPTCAISSPCRAFAAALTATTAGGEIIVLDSAGYGTVTIGQSVSIAAPAGIFAGVSVTSGDGIVVNGAGIKVELRGVSITGLGGATGINIQNAAKVVIADCRVSGMSGSGLANVGAPNLHIQDSIFRDNGGAGVSVTSGATTLLRVVSRNNGGAGATASGVSLSLVDSQISYNIGTGIAVNSFGYASVNNTVIQLNAGSGIDLTSGANARIDRSVISVNGTYGVHAASGSEVWLLRSTIQDNGQLDGSASEVCACAPFTGVRMSDNAVLSGVSLTALETVTNSTIALYTNNAIFGGQLGSGSFQTVPLR